MDWYEIGERWRAARDRLGHGDIEPALEQFAADNHIAANTIRRCLSGAATVRKLAGMGMGTVPEMAALPLKTVSAFQRLIRYGNDAVGPVVAAVLAEPSMSGSSVTRLETEARIKAERSTDPNRHLARLEAKGFEQAALKALSERMAAAGGRVAIVPSRASFAPFKVDAIVLFDTNTFIAVEVLVTIPGSAARPRAGEALMRGLAATNVFDGVVLLVGSDDDADWLSSILGRLRADGVAVARYDEDGGLDQLTLSRRRWGLPGHPVPPPFRHAYEEVLKALEPGQTRPRAGRRAH